VISYLENAKQKHARQPLVIMCKGSTPDLAEVEGLFKVSNFIPLSVPCVGRISDELLLTVAGMGVEGIYVLACDEDYCRFDRGSPLARRRIFALNRLLAQLGYGEEFITLKRNSLKVKVDKDRCISCGNCVFYCPYHAPKLESPGGVNFDLDACKGCGLCVVMCPAFALELEHWERERISALISKLLPEMKPPKLLVFRCQWAAFPSLDGELSPNVRLIDLPCASRVDAIHILDAFNNGADGVLVAACSEEDCKQEKASGRAQRSVAKLGGILSQIGYQDRLHFVSVAPRNGDGFNKELEQFSQKIKDQGAKK
jgi:coenzyme F420-reducing hydrogenase delta subunit